MVLGFTPRGRVALAMVPFPALLIVNLHPVDFPPGTLLKHPRLPARYLPCDIDPLDLGVEGTLASTGPLLEVIGEVPGLGPTLEFRLGGTIAPFLGSLFHRSVPPLFVVIRLGPDLPSPVVDLLSGLAKFILAHL